jgi:hypothetical protein
VRKDTVFANDTENDIFSNDVKIGTDVEYCIARCLMQVGVMGDVWLWMWDG